MVIKLCSGKLTILEIPFHLDLFCCCWLLLLVAVTVWILRDERKEERNELGKVGEITNASLLSFHSNGLMAGWDVWCEPVSEWVDMGIGKIAVW